MYPHHLPLLVCPDCKGQLRLAGEQESSGQVMRGELACAACDRRFPVVGGVPRFVPQDNYAAGFGLEWNLHARTQYDSYSGIFASRDRFFGQTRWQHDLRGETILEAGSGSGRFTEQAASSGATVVSFDYSSAVEANYASNGQCERVLIVQANIFAMPFRAGTFDKLFCFGVLQHTPDPERAFKALPAMLKPGARLCADIYKLALWRTLLQTKYYVRPFTRRIDPERLYGYVIRWVDFMWPLAGILRKLPRGYAINWRLLVADYSFLGLQGQMLKEWAYLDTFDMLSPRYDRPATLGTFRRWASEAGLEGVEAEYTPHGVVLRALGPGSDSSGAAS